MEPSDEKQPLFTTNGTDPTIERDEPFKRFGCTVLTVILVLLLLFCLIYFVTGIFAMILRTWEAMR